MITANGVVVEKPWYMSKKVWLCAIALAVAVYQDATGRWANVTPDLVVTKIAETASWLLPILGTIFSIAHVDAKTRAAALLADAVRTAASLEDKGAVASGNSVANPS